MREKAVRRFLHGREVDSLFAVRPLYILLSSILFLGCFTIEAAYAQPSANEIVLQLQRTGQVASKALRTDYQNLRVWSEGRDSSLLTLIESVDRDSMNRRTLFQSPLLRRESASLPPQLTRLSFFHPIDLFSDRIVLPDYEAPGPLGKYGLLDYTFSESPNSTSDTIVISFRHRGIFFPGIDGTLYVPRTSHQLARAEFWPTEAVNYGLLKEIRWSERYQNFNDIPMLVHSELSMIARTQIGFLPHYDVLITNDLRDYVFEEVSASRAHFDSKELDRVRQRSLTREEISAYERASALGTNGGGLMSQALSTFLDPDLLQYNRVEALRIQPHVRVSEIGMWPLAVSAMAAYGTGDRKFKYDIAAAQGLLWHDQKTFSTSIGMSGSFHTTVRNVPVPWLSLTGRLHDDRVLRGNARSIAMNTISALGYKSDFPDYFRSMGYSFGLTYKPLADLEAILEYGDDRQSSIDSVTATFSILSPHKPFRPNPPINDGRLVSLRGALDFNSLPEGRGQGKQFYSRLEITRAVPSAGDFDFVTASVHLAAGLPVEQWGLTTIYLDASATLRGALGNQHLFLFETPRGFSHRTRSFLTIRDREFQGDEVAMLFLEQDLYDLPVRLLAAKFLYPLDLHWFAFANTGWSKISDETLAKLRVPTESTGNTPYSEAGIGVGNIFNILRLDGAWRLTHRDAKGSPFVLIATIGLTL